MAVDGATDGATDAATSGLLDGNLLNVNVDLAADADIAAPINGAVAANANVAAPINAGVAANIGTVDCDAIAVAQQDAIINQNIEGEANADARPGVGHHPVTTTATTPRDRDPGRLQTCPARHPRKPTPSVARCCAGPKGCSSSARWRDPATGPRPRWCAAPTARPSS